MLGPVRAADLAPILYHEHLVLDNRRFPSLVDYWLPGPDVMTEEVRAFARAGGRSMISLTNQCMGRDVSALREIARASGINVLVATGYYTEPASPAIEDPRRVARELRRELEAGVAETGVRAAVIGEIGTGAWPIGDFEEKLFEAAAIAHGATGAPIATHSHAGTHAEWQVGSLTRRGVPAERIAVGHVDEGLGAPGHVDRLARIAGAGAYLGFDTVGITYFSEFMQQQLPSDADRASAIAKLVGLGLADRILIAHDICRPSHLRSGGGWGYAHLFESFVPLLEEHGVDRATAARFTGDNVVRWLAG